MTGNLSGMALFAATEDGRWHPGIGDPTPLGWLTVVAYFVAVGLCVRAAQRTPYPAPGRWLWRALTGLLTFLGVNKQLDLQSWVTQSGRDLLTRWGDYENRRTYQVAFIGLVAVVCFAGLVVFLRLARGDLRRRWLAVAGCLFLLGFVVVRASSFHHVDAFLAATIGGMRWNWVLELGGIGLIAVDAARVRPAAC